MNIDVGIWRTKGYPFHKPPLPPRLIESAIKQTKSMTQASMIIGCSYPTFRKWAKYFDLWKPNQSGKGISKKRMKKI